MLACAVCPIVRNIRAAATGGIYAAPTDQTVILPFPLGRGRGMPRPYRAMIFIATRESLPLGGKVARPARRMRGKCPEVATSSVGCADSFPRGGEKSYSYRLPAIFALSLGRGRGMPRPYRYKKSEPPAERREVHPLHLHQIHIKFHQKPCFSISLRPISTPITDAIIRPRVQPEESPRQCRPAMFVSRSVSILTLLE
mgnify:CR=1 FL=1